MSGILGQLASNKAVLGTGLAIGLNYFVAPVIVRAVGLQYYYTLGGLLGSVENAALWSSITIGAWSVYTNRDLLMKE